MSTRPLSIPPKHQLSGALSVRIVLVDTVGRPVTARTVDGALVRYDKTLELTDQTQELDLVPNSNLTTATDYAVQLTGTNPPQHYRGQLEAGADPVPWEQFTATHDLNPTELAVWLTHPEDLDRHLSEADRAKLDAVAANAYLHTQAVAATTWTVNHNLGHRPSVELLNTAGHEIDADVVHVSDNQCTVHLTLALAGSARCI